MANEEVRRFWIFDGGQWEGPFQSGIEAIEYCEANELTFAIYTTDAGSLPVVQEPEAWLFVSREAEQYIINSGFED